MTAERIKVTPEWIDKEIDRFHDEWDIGYKRVRSRWPLVPFGPADRRLIALDRLHGMRLRGLARSLAGEDPSPLRQWILDTFFSAHGVHFAREACITLAALPCTVGELNEVAGLQGWCVLYRSYLRQAMYEGVLARHYTPETMLS